MHSFHSIIFGDESLSSNWTIMTLNRFSFSAFEKIERSQLLSNWITTINPGHETMQPSSPTPFYPCSIVLFASSDPHPRFASNCVILLLWCCCFQRRASNRSNGEASCSSSMAFERDPRDYYNDLPGKIPPIPPDEKGSVVIAKFWYILQLKQSLSCSRVVSLSRMPIEETQSNGPFLLTTFRR